MLARFQGEHFWKGKEVQPTCKREKIGQRHARRSIKLIRSQPLQRASSACALFPRQIQIGRLKASFSPQSREAVAPAHSAELPLCLYCMDSLYCCIISSSSGFTFFFLISLLFRQNSSLSHNTWYLTNVYYLNSDEWHTSYLMRLEIMSPFLWGECSNSFGSGNLGHCGF